MSNKVDPTRVISDHIATLHDQRTNRIRKRDLALHYGLPVGAAVCSTFAGVRLADAGQIVAGAAVLAGFSFGLAIFVFQLRMDAARDPRVPRGSRLLDLIDELFTNVLYSIVVGLLLTVVTVAATALQDTKTLDAVWSGVMVGIAFHYLLTLAMCIKRLHKAYQELTI